VAVADGRVGAHHVQITMALIIPYVCALAPDQDDGQRMVVVGAVTVFQFNCGVGHGILRLRALPAANDAILG